MIKDGAKVMIFKLSSGSQSQHNQVKTSSRLLFDLTLFNRYVFVL